MASPHPTTIENLPDEVLSEIFIRLLSKQLAQMRCVCKPWNALLSESSFVKSHLHRSIHKNNEILLFFQRGFSFDCDPFTTRLSRSPNIKLTNFIKLPVNPQIKNCKGYIIGSVNGLICFYHGPCHNYAVGIWNPSLSAMLTLPPLCLPSRGSYCEFGFGFDSKTDDYKVVTITILFKPPNIVQAEVYSMRKGSWESISQKFPSHIRQHCGHNQICVDGHLHWLCVTNLEWKRKTILAFDLGAETFNEIPLLDSILGHFGYQLTVLGVLAGKICVMSCVRGGECEVWVMDEYGVAESWVKHHAFSQFNGYIFPFGFTSHDEFLSQVASDIDCDRFALYDPVAAKTKIFKVVLRQSSISNVVEYVDSLVWIAPANRLQT